MKFTIEFESLEKMVVRDKKNNVINEMGKDEFEKIKHKLINPKLKLECYKTNSGYVTIGGRTFYIP